METTVSLTAHDGWRRVGSAVARGGAYLDGTLRDASELAERADAADDVDALLAKLNGFFALVVDRPDRTDVAVDHVRSVPLFYAVDGDSGYVSDDALWLARQLSSPTRDPAAEREFLLGGLVTGADTLVRSIRQVQAGERISLCADGVTSQRYYEFAYDPATTADALDRLETVTREAFQRFVRAADGRPVAVSLSGGYDSRLVATMLSRLDYPDLRAYSYGREGSRDVRVARRVADALDIPWKHVAYTEQRWADWFTHPRRREYYRRAWNLASVPSLTGWPAVGALKRSGFLPPETVVVSGDSITTLGEHLPERFDRTPPSADAFAEAVRAFQFDLWETDDETNERLRDRIRRRYWPGTGERAAAAFQRFDWAERQAKFIVSPAEYEDWGFDWWLPLFDREYVAFWERVPLDSVVDRRLQRRYVDAVFEAETGIEGRVLPATPDAGAVDRLKRLVASSPLAPLARRLYWRAVSDPYRSDPTATFGIVPRDQFRRMYSGSENVHSFTALELAGRTRFGDDVGALPRRGHLTFDDERDSRPPWVVPPADDDGRGRTDEAGRAGTDRANWGRLYDELP